MAETQSMQTDGAGDAQVPVPSSSRQNGHAATVEDEPEEGAKLSGDVEMKPAEEAPSKKKVQAEEEEEDDGKLPANATETLYLQNLNEKVQVKGAFCKRISFIRADASDSDEAITGVAVQVVQTAGTYHHARQPPDARPGVYIIP